jgi:geranylgeranyl pyrophosphate synthase
MRLALRLGAILSGATEKQLSILSRFAELLGEAYQTSDDLLDLQEDAPLADSKLAARRPTFAFECGAQEARRRVANFVAEAKSVLASEFGESVPARILCEMTDYIAAREA